MKTILLLLTLSVFLTACSKSLRDAEIRQKIVGTWAIDSQPITFTFSSDGSFLAADTAKHTKTEGRWRIESGDYILTTSNMTTAKSYSERYRIVRISDHDLASRWNMNTNQLITAHKP
jgi:hypothetical protein